MRQAIDQQEVNDYYRLNLPNETERYIFRIAAIKILLENHQRYGYRISPEELYPPPALDTVDVKLKHKIHIPDLALASGTDYKTIRVLNPQFKNYYFPPGTYAVKVPKGLASKFLQQIKASSAEAAKAQAIQEGFQTSILTTSMQGEAAQRGQELGRYLCKMEETRPQCVIVGGETTVTLDNATGLGGRNQELALAAVNVLKGSRDVMLITLATDGDDGPTDAAGAVVTGETWLRAQKLGLSVDIHLREHNAYPFFKALDDLLITGPTGTNVNDLTFLFTFKLSVQ